MAYELEKKAALEAVSKHGKALALELVEIAIVPALKTAAAASENKIDDAIIAMLEVPLKDALKDLIAKA